MIASLPTPLPQGMTDVDYEAIEAAVTETVRGRWFLAEFARRNRGAEVKLMLDAMSRLETMVSAQGQAAQLPPPSSDPSIRLMLQRIKEIASSLDTAAHDMRDNGVAARYWAPVEQQARAVAGLMRAGILPEAKTAGTKTGAEGQSLVEAPALEAAASPPAARAPEPLRLPHVNERATDPRVQVFSGLEALPLAQKMSFFT